MYMQDGEEPILEFCGKKTEKRFVVEDVENLKAINKIVPIAGNSNSQGPSISGVVSHKMKSDVFQKVS